MSAAATSEETAGRSVFEAELALPGGTARIMRLSNEQASDDLFRRDRHYWLDLCLTPRPDHARGCYLERWGPHRFERLGEMFLVPPREALHIRTDAGGRQLSIVCEIAADAVDRWLDRPLDWTDRRLASGLDMNHPHVRACLLRLAQEVRHGGTGSAELAALVAGQLAIDLARHLEAIADGPVTGGLAGWRLRLIDDRLDRAGPPPTLRDLAAACGMSVRQLTRGFRVARGCTIGEHLAQVRIEQAKRALAASDSIKAIAFALGFASPSAFSHAFGRATGMTPLAFRQRLVRAT